MRRTELISQYSGVSFIPFPGRFRRVFRFAITCATDNMLIGTSFSEEEINFRN